VSDVVPILYRKYGNSGAVFDRVSDSIEGIFIVMLVEQPEKTPDSKARPIIIFGFDINRPPLDYRRPTWCFP